MFVYLAVVVVSLLVTHLLLNYNAKARLLRKIPGPKDSFIVGNCLQLLVTPVEVMRLGREWALTWEKVYRFWSFPFGAVTIFNPKDIEVMISSVKHNNKSLIYGFLRPWLRDGLLVSSGEKWQRRRKLLTPAFHFNILRKFFVVLEENTQRLVRALAMTKGEKVDIVPILSEFTLHSICETSMGTHLDDDKTGAACSYKHAIYGVGEVVIYRLLRIYLYIDTIFYNTPMGRKMNDYLDILHGFTRRVIRDRRDFVDQYGIKAADIEGEDEVYRNKKRTAMMDLLLLAEKDGLIDEAGIQEEIDTFMFEGHDTTASALNFCLLELANNKSIQDKICEELKDIYGDTGRSATSEDLTKMRYLELCIKESLRLYPPVHFISRTLDEQVTLSDYEVPAGTICNINILDLHRNPLLYEDAETFNPDRFLPENSVGRHPYAYIPFSAGPRNCIGQKFAIMEIKLAVSEILRNFELVPDTRVADLKFSADLVLRNANPIYLSFVKRNN